jgi:aminopeptidase N
MSTYLVAFAVTDFTVEEVTTSRVRAYGCLALVGIEEAQQETEYSLSVRSKIMDFYEDYFILDFPLPKEDNLAIPDFKAGGMEKWSLINNSCFK